MRNWTELAREEQDIVLDIFEQGPDCAKFISRRHTADLGETMARLRQLESDGWLERVKGTFLFKKVFHRPKHMNHTYYDLSRRARLTLRKMKQGKKI
jgi:predicted transcriptional regulator